MSHLELQHSSSAVGSTASQHRSIKLLKVVTFILQAVLSHFAARVTALFIGLLAVTARFSLALPELLAKLRPQLCSITMVQF